MSKPTKVFLAEIALWVWTAWVCIYGVLDTKRSIPEFEQSLNDQLQGAISIPPETLFQGAIAGYIILAVISIWVVLKIGAGKHWARSSLMWGFVFQIGTMIFPPYHALKDYVIDIPDVGLQLYAIYVLYTPPCKAWFDADAPTPKKRG